MSTQVFCKPMTTSRTPARVGQRGEIGPIGPSGNAKVDALFRVMSGEPSSDDGGVEIPPAGSGVLARFSILDAFKTIKANTQRNVDEARAKMRLGSRQAQAPQPPALKRIGC
jgi:hypothetical protein